MEKDPAIALIEAMGKTWIASQDSSPIARSAALQPLCDEINKLPPFSAWVGRQIPYGADGAVGMYQAPHGIAELAAKGVPPPEIIAEFEDMTAANSADFLTVFLIRGFEIHDELKLERDVWLCKPEEAPPSGYWRNVFARPEEANYVPGGGLLGFSDVPKCALVIRETVEPIIPRGVFDFEKFENARRPKRDAVLMKARDVLRSCILAGSTAATMPVYYTVCDTRLYPANGMQSMSSFTTDGTVYPFSNTNGAEVASWYKRLRVCRGIDSVRLGIDRIGRARLDRDLSDAALDLGLAMEVLLLHEDTDRNKELNHKIGLRAGWLMGADLATRKEHKKLASQLYGHRSAAAHEGKLRDDFDRAGLGEFVTNIARKIVTSGGFPEWVELTFGA